MSREPEKRHDDPSLSMMGVSIRLLMNPQAADNAGVEQVHVPGTDNQADVKVEPEGELVKVTYTLTGPGAPVATRLQHQIIAKSGAKNIYLERDVNGDKKEERVISVLLLSEQFDILKEYFDKMDAYFTANHEARAKLDRLVKLANEMEAAFPPTKVLPSFNTGTLQFDKLNFNTNNPDLIGGVEDSSIKGHELLGKERSWYDSKRQHVEGGIYATALEPDFALLEALVDRAKPPSPKATDVIDAATNFAGSVNHSGLRGRAAYVEAVRKATEKRGLDPHRK